MYLSGLSGVLLDEKYTCIHVYDNDSSSRGMTYLTKKINVMIVDKLNNGKILRQNYGVFT